MRNFVLVFGLITFIGCGKSSDRFSVPDPEWASYLADRNLHDYAGLEDNIYHHCNANIEVPLKLFEQKRMSMEFKSNSLGVSEIGALGAKASDADRCRELSHYLSGGSSPAFGLEIFLSDNEEDGALGLGNWFNARPEIAEFHYSDGIFSSRSKDLEVRCQQPFRVKCQSDAGRCVDYIINAPSQTCTFRGAFLPFGFSDHKNNFLDIGGEILFSGTSSAVLNINKISWALMY
jgi:hypothetical protein